MSTYVVVYVFVYICKCCIKVLMVLTACRVGLQSDPVSGVSYREASEHTGLSLVTDTLLVVVVALSVLLSSSTQVAIVLLLALLAPCSSTSSTTSYMPNTSATSKNSATSTSSTRAHRPQPSHTGENGKARSEHTTHLHPSALQPGP